MSRATIPLRRHPDGVFIPEFLVRVGAGDRSRLLTALLDTGATYTLANRSIATRLGLTWDQGARVLIQFGGSKRPVPAYRHDLTASVLQEGSQFPVLQFEQVAVHFVDASLPGDRILLGQRDWLERMRLVQRNQGDRPFLILDTET